MDPSSSTSLFVAERPNETTKYLESKFTSSAAGIVTIERIRTFRIIYPNDEGLLLELYMAKVIGQLASTADLRELRYESKDLTNW